MTWILASSLLLGAVLITGFAWYERTHPTTRVLALVAALAALAALGRVAFAPLPNVKPTTDIVLIAGLVLGGAPGFMVGAIAGLASNVFFGQGPWTPWQMAAWGAVGVAGALFARALGGRPPGRVPLAIVCGLAGLALRRGHEPPPVGHLLGRPHARQARRLLRDLAAVRHRARARQRRLRARLRARADPRPGALPDADGGDVAPEPGRRRRRARGRRARGRRRRRRRGPARAGADRRRGRRQGLAALPGRRPERGRRLGRRARAVLDAAPHGLDRARPRRRGPQPARRRLHDRDRLHARPRARARRPRRAVAHDPRLPRGRALAARRRRPRPGRGAAAQAQARTGASPAA